MINVKYKCEMPTKTKKRVWEKTNKVCANLQDTKINIFLHVLLCFHNVPSLTSFYMLNYTMKGKCWKYKQSDNYVTLQREKPKRCPHTWTNSYFDYNQYLINHLNQKAIVINSLC
jgi:hypothetical protein